MPSTAQELRTEPVGTHTLASLSRGLVQLFRHRAGRGPTQAKSFWAGDDMRSIVETTVGREVVAVLASAHHNPDVMAAVFLLEPLGGSGSGE